MAYTTIDDPSKHFNTLLYTGKGDEQTIIGTGFKPDLIWAKSRTNAHYNDLRDSSRGVTKRLVSNESDAESTKDQSYVSFDSDGFSLGDDTDGSGNALNTVNTSSNNYVAWQWKANGGTTSSNTDGDITTTVQANTTAGFSIATYTGNGGSGQTLGHGLGAEAELVWFKNRGSTGHNRLYLKLLGASKFLNLNTDDAASASTNIFPSASSTTIGVEQNDTMNESSGTHVMYSFRSIQGYSKIGSYEGNGHATDGPFVYTGFKPAWLLYRNVDRTENWIIVDNKRNPINRVAGANLQANVADAEANETRWGFDFLSNGFKVRQTQAQNANNGDEETIIYMAFAESPFVTSNGTPNNAR